MSSRGHDNAEDEIGAAARKKRMNVSGDDDGLFKREFVRAPFGAPRVEVGKADNAQAGDFRGRLQPSTAHCAAADKGGPQLNRRLFPRSIEFFNPCFLPTG
jgi:hypothetical protein